MGGFPSENQPEREASNRSRGFAVGLVLLSIVFVAVTAMRGAPEAMFGSSHDDSLYFSTAKALAAGEGLVMPNVPGEPPQTKYPALYPLLLSAVWLIEPDFPANLDWAWALTVAFGVLGVIAFGLLARQLGAGPVEALILTAAAALNPFFVYFSNLLVSDIIFAPLAVGAAVLAHDALSRPARDHNLTLRWAGVALLLVLACWARTVGVAFVAGIAATALWRRQWKPAVWAFGGVAPVALAAAGVFGRASLPPSAEVWEGFRQNLLYYTSYSQFWLLSVPSWEVFWAQLSFNMTELLKHPANALFLMGSEGFVPMWHQLLAITFSIGIVAGVVRRAKQVGLHPIHLAGVFYIPIVLLWNYPLMTRFGLPFSILLLAGASDQVQAIALQLRQTWNKGPVADRLVGAAFVAGLMGILGLSAYRWAWDTPRALQSVVDSRLSLTEPKLEAYAWVAANTEPGAVVISYEDASLYLYTGRQSMRPASLTTEAFYMQDMGSFEDGLDKLADTAFALDADYWVLAPDNFGLAIDPETTRSKVEELLDGLPVVFTSGDGRLRVVRLEGERWAELRERRLAGRPAFAEALRSSSD